MRVVVLHNPRSGRGLAERLSGRIGQRLRARGHEVDQASALDQQGGSLAGADALILVGGDGTVSHAVDAAAQAQVPVYHAGTGNENLFARTFGMKRSPDAVAAAVDANTTAPCDLVRSEGRPVLMMLSVGPDSGVIHRVAHARTMAVGHLAYIEPVAKAILDPHRPILTVVIDGTPIAQNEPGQLIIANTRAYALGIDPARDAAPDTGKLHVAFLPARSSFAIARAFAGLRVGLTPAKLRTASGSRVVVQSSEPMAPQADGEAWWLTPASEQRARPNGIANGRPNGRAPEGPRRDRLEATIEPAALRVLLPA